MKAKNNKKGRQTKNKSASTKKHTASHRSNMDAGSQEQEDDMYETHMHGGYEDCCGPEDQDYRSRDYGRSFRHSPRYHQDETYAGYYDQNPAYGRGYSYEDRREDDRYMRRGYYGSRYAGYPDREPYGRNNGRYYGSENGWENHSLPYGRLDSPRYGRSGYRRYY